MHDRVLREDGDVDQAPVVPVDRNEEGVGAATAEVLASEALQRVEVFNLLQGEDVRVRLLDRSGPDLLALLVEDGEEALVCVPAVADRFRCVDVREFVAGEEVFDVELPTRTTVIALLSSAMRDRCKPM